MAFIRDAQRTMHTPVSWLEVGGSRHLCWGKEWFVNSSATNAGDTTRNGKSKTTPFNTLGYAFSSDLVAAGDVIHVGPGHEETVASATACALDIAGVHVIGYGGVTNRPTFTITTLSTAEIAISAANITLENLRFVAGKASADDIADMVDISAAGTRLIGCEFRDGGATKMPLNCIKLSGTGADDTKILKCDFLLDPTDAHAAHAIAIDAVVERTEIGWCRIMGDYSDACIHSGSKHTMCYVHDNLLWNENGTYCIEFTQTASGMISYNVLGSSITQATAIDGGSCYLVENYHCDAADVSGILCPAGT